MYNLIFSLLSDRQTLQWAAMPVVEKASWLVISNDKVSEGFHFVAERTTVTEVS